MEELFVILIQISICSLVLIISWDNLVKISSLSLMTSVISSTMDSKSLPYQYHKIFKELYKSKFFDKENSYKY